ncbi:MAG: glycosyltransferase family 2 protein [Thauera sp.]
MYDIALETIAHGDGRVDMESLSGFVAAYQNVSPMKLGELWAIPIMLRLAVIENLRRVGVRIAAGWAERNLAAGWADRMAETAVSDPKSLILVIADMACSDPPMVGGFVAELARRLQGRGPTLALPLTWIEQRLSESGLTIEHLVQSENQQQAADQVSISNSIGSLRVLSATDWRRFVETQSVVEHVLGDDPGGVYGRMDFATRDRYRHAIERIAKKGDLSEGEVARKAVELARLGAAAVDAGTGTGDRAGHVGYYLIDKGLPQLERAAHVRLSGAEALGKMAGRFPSLMYLGGIALITLALSGSLLAQAFAAGTPDLLLVPLGILALLAASRLGVALVNWLATLLVAPHPLPRMDFSEGIPAQARTLVVVPTMLSSASGVEELIEALEVRFLANRDERLHFGLLTDFRDARQETMPDDGLLLQLARTKIGELNSKYGGDGARIRDDLFFLFHRPRRWNPKDRLWMGYERKRGKLADLNALLRGGAKDRFMLVVGETAVLSSVKYVITLDTDTQLPRDAARKFVGTMAHPLNRPGYDKVKRRVTEGYGILQPRVAIGLPGTNRSRYARLYGGEPGIDPYTRAVSDVYQDLFGEGSFIGKGIYDVDAFEQALGGRFPENRILSHDLLEGCYARSALLSDVHLYEDHPARYSADVSRRYRWIRGDWQLAGWLRRHVPGAGAAVDTTRQKNPLSLLSQWKLFDNLRRSLVPAALTLLLLAGWTLLAPAGWWTLAVIGIMLLPALCAAILDAFRKPEEVRLRQHFATVARSAWRHLMQGTFELACLPYEALFSVDAVSRTTWRILVTRARLLEWNPSREADREAGERHSGTLAGGFRAMWFAPAIATVAAIHLAASRPAVLAIAGPILLLWFASPVIAWWLSCPLVPRKATLTVEQTLFLRALSRRTWAFFDHFVSPDDHWLPPDNIQEYRIATVAHRTSPTNIGLALLANLSAYDFGYIVAGSVLKRTANTLKTMDALERHRGHFYNWYDTQTLQPLPPLYISTVDSGNLAGHLLTLRAGLLALADDTILPARLFEGLDDTLRILLAEADKAVTEQAKAFRDELESALTAPPDSLAAARARLERLATSAAELATQAARRPPGGDITAPEGDGKGRDEGWAQALARQCREGLDELCFLAPWQLLPSVRSEKESFADLVGIPTLRELAMAGSTQAGDRMAAIERLARRCLQLARMEYDFLYDPTRHLLSIGYNVAERRADTGYYDLLASEARLCNFVATTTRCSTRPAKGRSPGRSRMGTSAACLGACRNPATTPSTCISITSTAPSVCPAWDSNADWPTIWSLRPMPRPSR